MFERTLTAALAHAEDVKQRGNHHCLMCTAPKNDHQHQHAEAYGAQLKADAYCVILAEEIQRLRKDSK